MSGDKLPRTQTIASKIDANLLIPKSRNQLQATWKGVYYRAGFHSGRPGCVTNVAVDRTEERSLLIACHVCAIFLKRSRQKCKLALAMTCC
jgi:hypothetical protein